MPNQILSVGPDDQLQRLRKELLEAAGYRVDVAANFAQAAVALDNGVYDVAVLCESLPAGEAERLVHAIGIISPNTGIVRQQRLALRLVEEGPEMLLHLVRAGVLRSRKVRAALLRSRR
jgi:hypothetical protein